MGYCVHRYSLVKRWQEGNEWVAIQRCRRCDDWKRVTISLSKRGAPTKKTERIVESGLEKNVQEDANPIVPRGTDEPKDL